MSLTLRKIVSLEPILLSSKYGDGNNLGQVLGLKTIGFVRVVLDDGTCGFGESYVAIYTPELFHASITFLKELLVGQEFSLPTDIYDNFHIPFVSRNGLLQSSFAAVDMALWDAYCKSIQTSFSSCTGLPFSSTPQIYYSGGSARMSPEEIAKEASTLDTTIFAGYKMRVGYYDWNEDLVRIDSALASNKTPHLMVDAIMGTIRPSLSLSDWIPRLSQLEERNITWLEEPLHPDEFNAISDLRRQTKLDIAMGEAMTGRYELNTSLKEPALDVLQLDFTHIGGPSFFLDTYSDLKSSTKSISMHVWGSPLAFNVNTYLGMLLPNCRWTEYPSVSLDVNTHLDRAYFNRKPSLNCMYDLVGFSPSALSTFDYSMYPYVSGASFRWQSRHDRK